MNVNFLTAPLRAPAKRTVNITLSDPTRAIRRLAAFDNTTGTDTLPAPDASREAEITVARNPPIEAVPRSDTRPGLLTRTARLVLRPAINEPSCALDSRPTLNTARDGEVPFLDPARSVSTVLSIPDPPGP